MHEQEQDIEELESSAPVQSEDRMTAGNLTDELSLIEKELQILKNIDLNDERIFSTKQAAKKEVTSTTDLHYKRTETSSRTRGHETTTLRIKRDIEDVPSELNNGVKGCTY
ncbi:hypothetical protein TNCV_977211 [Trichonephila clavipes]|nr:hypothetical protein TNCV_977211 [Trichonephila clavipes]